jgi:hypothetical protein
MSSKFSSDEEDENALDRAHVLTLQSHEHEAIEKRHKEA